MAQKIDQRSAIRLCNKNTTALREVNREILYYLDRLPLKSQKDVVKLNRLLVEQEKLVRVRLKGHVPVRVEIFNDNERYRANHLRRRFRNAERRDRVREPVVDKWEKKVIYLGSNRASTLHLPECRWVNKVSPKNMIVFDSRAEAVNKGYKPCKTCQP
ncbi:Ada metal-binding domain-containing protein [Thermodesulfobacteriota bacterium]